LRVGDKISIRPGLITRNQKTGNVQWREIESQITSLKADENQLMYAVPGGLIGVGMKVDPFITRSDSLVGQIIGLPNKMPEVLSEIDVTYFLLKRLLGVKNQEKTVDGEKKTTSNKIKSLQAAELLMINVGS
jgi:translation initiation factor 2 subunit 3